MNAEARQAKTPTAIFQLALATIAWGLSFTTAKAAMQVQQAAAPGHQDYFHAALLLCNRMALAVIVMLLLLRGRALQLTRLELRQGLELGIFGGLGMLLQTDAQHHIDASASAFFTQFTSVFVPIVVALRSRRLPPLVVFVSCFLVLAGCMILSGVSLEKISLRRGEWETILSALAFTGQILCLERSRFFANDSMRTATVMFAVKGGLFLPLVLMGGGLGAAWQASSSGAAFGLVAILTLACTVYAYVAMTHWQPFVTATQAGIIYATEPIFAALWAFILPGWISAFAGIHYANEELRKPLLYGGALILLANVLLIFRPSQRPHGDPPPIT